MRAVIQRVTSASVTVNQSEIAKIGKGLCVLIGIGTDDTKVEMNYIISKILSLRLFPSSSTSSNRSQIKIEEPTVESSKIDRRGQEGEEATYERVVQQKSSTSVPSNQPSLTSIQPNGAGGEASQINVKQWSQSVKDIRGEILIVSQFTLMAKTKKGSKPDFHNAMKSDSSKELYDAFIQSIKSNYAEDLVQGGRFGEMMQVNISNEGPVTIILDTNNPSF